MNKAGTRFILLFTLLWGSGNFFTMKKGGPTGNANVTAYCPTPPKCDVDGFQKWYKVDKFCVQYFSPPQNFTQAEINCRSTVPGGHLVSVHNKEANDYLVNIVKENSKNLRIWLGAYEFFKSGKFLWIDGTFWDYEAWKPGEPNHIFTSTEECVEMNWDGEGKWNDESCGNKKNYICAFKRKHLLDE